VSYSGGAASHMQNSFDLTFCLLCNKQNKNNYRNLIRENYLNIQHNLIPKT